MDRVLDSDEQYALVDSGGCRKLERFGEVLLDRPSPQAIWPPDPGAPWGEARAAFHRGRGGDGDWRLARPHPPEGWIARFAGAAFEIRLTGFGNVGLFPEHAVHFSWIAERLAGRERPAVLNLFAYTGAASIACALAGARVTHVDAARSVNGWARANAEKSGVPAGAIRYLADDARKLLKREQRRGRRYDGVILDPPSFGRGPKGEVWKLEEMLPELVDDAAALLGDRAPFFVLTAHSPGITPSVLRALLGPHGGEIDSGEMLLAGGGPPLPAGVFARLAR